MENKVITVEPIQTADAVQANTDAVLFHNESKSLIIKMQPDYDMAGTLLQKIKGRAKTIEEKRKEITKPLDAAKKAVMDLFRGPLITLAAAESTVKRSMITFEIEQEKIRKDQEEKLQRQAKAEEDRKKKVLEEQARKKEEEARKLREGAEKANAEEKARLEAEAKKKEEQAEAKREKAEDVHVEAPILAPRVEKPKGISYKEQWRFRIVDKDKLPREYMVPNELMLRKLAVATKGKIPVAGVEFYSEKVTMSRSA